MRLWIVAAAYGLWLFGITEVFYLVGGTNENALQFAVMAGAVPVALQLFLLGLDPLGLVAPTKFSLVLLFVIMLSYLGNAHDWLPLIYLCNLAFVLTVAILVAGSPDRRLLRSVAAIASLSIGVLLLYVNFAGEYVWGRLSAHGIQPNFWGTVGLAVAVAALATRSRLVAGFGLAVGLLTIYDASARGSLMGFVAAALALLITSVPNLRNRRLVTTIVAVGAILAAAIVIEPYVPNIADAISSDLLKLDDPNRGIGTGFTGRTDLWGETLAVWARAPLFGVGYHQHQYLLSSEIGAHNAYLAMLADTGIFGFVLYCALLVWAFRAALPIGDRGTRRLILAVVACYAVYGLFEARAFNNGNPLSLLFIMCCFYALADQQRRRAAAPLGYTLPIGSEPGLRS